ncbi:MAG: TonB family protein [Thermodesulfovibrio sp.]|uniref:TonB family protein n=1 Tax=Thermodesulfovibrio obliviosus TaxID=3118332 RepID=A0AAU8H504_9BACT
MKILYVNKLQYFILLSIFLHILFFITLSSFARLNQERQAVEIFIINEELQKSHETLSMPNVPHKKTLKAFAPLLKKQSTVESKKDAPVDNSKTEKTMVIEPASSNQTTATTGSGSLSSADHSTTEKTGVIDTEFGTAYGPKFIHRAIPVYPQIARRLGKEGRVILRLTLNEKGELINIEVIQGAPYGFTESAVEAVKKSKFSPATKNGKPVPCRAILPVRFVLK